MKTLVKITALLTALLFIAGSVNAGRRDPVAVLFQVKGKVEYSKDGKEWRKVRRNKFLFEGYKLRSGEDGTGRITVKQSGRNFDLKPNTKLEVSADDLVIQEGDLEKASLTSRLISGLIKKFSRSQSYTTVRRSASKQELDAVRSVVVSNEHPFLVWDNICPECSYKLILGDETYEVPSTTDKVVRIHLNPFNGTKAFKIAAIKDGTEVDVLKQYRSRGEYKDHTISWIDGERQQQLENDIAALAEEYGDESFMLGSFYEKEDMWVAAMDHYRNYLTENPDDYEMTPYLFRVYKKLKLDTVYKAELEEWQKWEAEEF